MSDAIFNYLCIQYVYFEVYQGQNDHGNLKKLRRQNQLKFFTFRMSEVLKFQLLNLCRSTFASAVLPYVIRSLILRE